MCYMLHHLNLLDFITQTILGEEYRSLSSLLCSFTFWLFRNIIRFYSEELLAPCPTPKLEDHPLSDVRNC
jgi:hypothetical protein